MQEVLSEVIGKKLLNLGANIVAVDIKPINLWFQLFENVENHSLDLKNLKNCEEVIKDCDFVFNMACNMGGMGFIENNKAECMLSVLINTNLLICAKKYNIKKYFFLLVHAYITQINKMILSLMV